MTFSPEERQSVLDRILLALRSDSRIAGVLIVGSGAGGFEDRYSDIDLSVVVAEEDEVLPVFGEWRGWIEQLFPIVHRFEITYGPSNYLHGFLLDGYLELNIGFLCLANLSARRERWEVAFDRSGKIEGIMQSSWAERPQTDIRAAYLRRLNSIWHYIIQVAVALERGQPWRALHELEQIRNRTVELAGLRRGLETRHFRQVDRMPEEFLAELKETLVSTTDSADIMRALKVAAASSFREARVLDEMLGLDVARGLEFKMQEYLGLFSYE
jgi:predicted nucleotidyltransferase